VLSKPSVEEPQLERESTFIHGPYLPIDIKESKKEKIDFALQEREEVDSWELWWKRQTSSWSKFEKIHFNTGCFFD